MFRYLVKYLKSKANKCQETRAKIHYQEGFEFAMSAYWLCNATIEEISGTVSRSPDSFDLGVLKAIRVINRMDV